MNNLVIIVLVIGAVALLVTRTPIAVPKLFLTAIDDFDSELDIFDIRPDTFQAVKDPVTTAAGAFELARQVSTQSHQGRVDPQMATTIAFIESSFNPTAIRVEIAIGDASVGLMQTLVTTAQWLYDSQGYRNFSGRPDFTSLFDPEVSMFFGQAYLDYLARTNSLTRGKGEEVIVRGYNGGPGGAFKSFTDGYWNKYQKAKKELFG